MKLIIISGRSGSGKSVSLHTLEDLGFYCVDGVPLNLLPALIEQLGPEYGRLATSIDARNLPPDYHRLEKIFNELKTATDSCEIIFLDTENETLLKRFSETRRKHPLTDDYTSLYEALRHEEQLLRPLQAMAALNVDTNQLSIHQLREIIRAYVTDQRRPKLALLLQSFGFKFGLPVDSDYVFDVRCLPNPYWEASLRNHTGLEQPVIDYLQEQSAVVDMLEQIKQFLNKWIPAFEDTNRQYLTISIGCTGGQHRSVYLTEQLGQYFQDSNKQIQIRHRELL